MDINKKIQELCYQRDWTLYTLSLESGVPQSTLQSMFNRGSAPKVDTLQIICSTLGITLSQFFNESEDVEILTESEKKLVDSFRAMPEEKQKALIDFLTK